MFFKPKKLKEPKRKLGKMKDKQRKQKPPKKPYTIEEMMLYDWILED